MDAAAKIKSQPTGQIRNLGIDFASHPQPPRRTHKVDAMNKPESSNPDDAKKKTVSYGNPIVGVWRCPNCDYDCFPRHLSEANVEPPFLCPRCDFELYYDEEE